MYNKTQSIFCIFNNNFFLRDYELKFNIILDNDGKK